MQLLGFVILVSCNALYSIYMKQCRNIIANHSLCLLVCVLHPGFTYPIYAVQWHPEKAPYEWKDLGGISHAPNAVKTAFYLADFLVSEGNVYMGV